MVGKYRLDNVSNKLAPGTAVLLHCAHLRNGILFLLTSYTEIGLPYMIGPTLILSDHASSASGTRPARAALRSDKK